MTDELPDAIGWNARGFSTLVECKVSRSDFQRDTKKPFRARPGMGMGYQRYYFTPVDLVTAEEVPDGWGLLYCKSHGVSVVKVAPPRLDGWDRFEELKHLLAELRRRDGVVKTVKPKGTNGNRNPDLASSGNPAGDAVHGCAAEVRTG
jgi:hypothetical protein